MMYACCVDACVRALSHSLAPFPALSRICLWYARGRRPPRRCSRGGRAQGAHRYRWSRRGPWPPRSACRPRSTYRINRAGTVCVEVRRNEHRDIEARLERGNGRTHGAAAVVDRSRPSHYKRPTTRQHHLTHLMHGQFPSPGCDVESWGKPGVSRSHPGRVPPQLMHATP